MEAAVDKRYKFINGETGYVIYYHTLNCTIPAEKFQDELESVKKRLPLRIIF